MAKTIKCRIEKVNGKFIVVDNESNPLIETKSFHEATKFITKIQSPKSIGRPTYEF